MGSRKNAQVNAIHLLLSNGTVKLVAFYSTSGGAVIDLDLNEGFSGSAVLLVTSMLIPWPEIPG